MKTGRSILLETGIVLTVILMPVLFGSVHAWAAMPFAILLFFVVFLSPETLDEIATLPFFFRWAMFAVFTGIAGQWVWTAWNREAVAYELLKWLGAACLFLLCQKLSRESLLRLCWIFVGLGVMITLYGIFETVTGQEMVLWQKKRAHLGFATGTYLNRNHFAGFLELAAGFVLGLGGRACYRRKLGGIVAALFSLGVLLTGLVWSGSRMAVLSLTFSLFVFSLLLLRRSLNALLLFIGVTLPAALASLYSGRRLMASRFYELGDQWVTLEGRLTVWRDTLRMIRDHGWSGVGLGNFKWAFPAYQSEHLTYGWDYAHQDYLQLMAELGVPLFILLLVAFGGLYLVCLVRADQKDFSTFAMVWGGLIGVTALGLHGFSDFNFAIPANAWAFIFVLAVVTRFLKFQRMRLGERPHA